VYEKIIYDMLETARQAGEMLNRDFHDHSSINRSFKNKNSIVTDADFAVEALIKNSLHKKYPEHSILLEESGLLDASDADPHYRWIIDPIDGTNNFIRGCVNYCISVGLVRFENNVGRSVAGVIFMPRLGEIYWAYEGNGAHWENAAGQRKKLHVKHHDEIENSLIQTSYFLHKNNKYKKLCDKFYSEHAKIRISGSIASDIANFASGKADIVIHGASKQWDIAAGVIIAQEAGGIVTSLEGEDNTFFDRNHVENEPSIIIANRPLHRLIMQCQLS
jgi:myo-inositol-1(or 4)-monophosphatase